MVAPSAVSVFPPRALPEFGDRGGTRYGLAETEAAAIRARFPQVSATLADAIVGVAHRIGTEPLWLANNIAAESGFNPAARNPRGSATGLIQIIEDRARQIGTTTAALARMSAPAQMAYVERYYRAVGGPFRPARNLYLATFLPGWRRYPDSTQLPAATRAVNPGINTLGDYVVFVERQADRHAHGAPRHRRTRKGAPAPEGGEGGGILLLGLFVAGAVAARGLR